MKIETKYGQAAFRAFIKSEFSEENLDFWLACEDFKKTKSPTKRLSKAENIYATFIQVGAPREINIDFAARDIISKNISDPTLSHFDNAQKIICSLMAKDSYPRFLKSAAYLEIVNKTGNKSQRR
nr:PREDICTED: regulator of G-protein signaling 21 [Latimeria chalumnae]|eukprot:XP_006007575.1 PREDICTED: regulator of G-protein signaling 21 [Latimeria chalumnae]